MADQSNEAPGRSDRGRNEEPDRPRAGRGPSLAEEGADDLPALLIIAVGIAVIVVLLLQSGARIPGLTPTDAVVAGAAVDEEEDHGAEAAEDTDEAAAEDADEAAEAADEADEAEAPTDELTIAAGATSAEVTVTATQATLVLAGTVPRQAIADELGTRALAIYAPDQIDDQLMVDEAAEPPIVVTVTGSMTDQALFDSLTRAFTGIVGIDNINTESLELKESNELEAALLALPPIEFDSGSAVILPASATILDQVALLLAEDSSVAIEIGGHTDSRGSDESNQGLSQARAESVLAALIERGALNEMAPRGFGESRLKVDPETTLEDQQANRRIEFRILD